MPPFIDIGILDLACRDNLGIGGFHSLVAPSGVILLSFSCPSQFIRLTRNFHARIVSRDRVVDSVADTVSMRYLFENAS